MSITKLIFFDVWEKRLIFDIDKNVVTQVTHYMVCQWVEAILGSKKTKCQKLLRTRLVGAPDKPKKPLLPT